MDGKSVKALLFLGFSLRGVLGGGVGVVLELGFGLGVFCFLVVVGFLCFGFFVLGFNGAVKTSTCKVRVSCLQDMQCEKKA